MVSFEADIKSGGQHKIGENQTELIFLRNFDVNMLGFIL